MNPQPPNFGFPGRKLEGLSIPGVLRISFDESVTGFPFRPVGEFPRRVEEGEPLAYAADFPLFAPLSGLVRLDEASSSFLLKMEGALRLGSRTVLKNPASMIGAATGGRGYELFLEQLLRGGLPALDFPSCTLHGLFTRVLAFPRPQIVISTADSEGAVDWDRLLNPQFLKAWRRLLTQVLAPFPAAKIFYVPSAHYFRRKVPAIPEVIAASLRAFPVDFSVSLEEQGILYLGPATLYALLDYLYNDRPFYTRIAVVRATYAVRKCIKFTGTRLYPFPNGFGLDGFFREQLLQKERVRLVSGSIFRQAACEITARELPVYNIYGHTVFSFLSRSWSQRTIGNLPCSGCMYCQKVCPVDASPLSLLEGRADQFRAEVCLDCGLCEYVCDSGLALSRSISNRKEQLGLPVRKR